MALQSIGIRSKEQSRQAGFDVANREQYLTILGGPGAGKSTFLRKIGMEALKGRRGKIQHRCIPIFLELKRFDTDEIDIKQLIIEEFRTCGFPDPEAFATKALRQGRLLVLLDGLDEVPTQNLTQVIRKIQDFVDRYNKNRFIASCRVAAYHGYFKRFTDIAISEFDKNQIKQFIHNWFQSELDNQEGTADNCWKLLQRPENSAAMELAQTPLLLTFLCLVYDRSQNLPDNRSTLYRKALDILLEEWASEKRIQREAIYQGLHTDLEKALLSEIAYTKFEADQLFFSKQEIINQITAFLTETLDAPQHLDGKAVLDAIEVQQGILVERAEDIYSFSHLTIQEFLTARYVANNQKRLEKLVSEHLTDSRWREVFLLVAGLKDSADDFLLEIEKRAPNFLRTKRLEALIREVDRIAISIRGDYKPSAKRALLIFSVFDRDLALDHVRDLVRVLARDRAFALVRALACDVVHRRDYNLGRGHDRDLVRELARDLVRELDLAQAFVFNLVHVLDLVRILNLKEIKALVDYLTTILIMVQCKQSAIRVSQKIWYGIEERMLTVSEKKNLKSS